jgi:hypothetical protein
MHCVDTSAHEVIDAKDTEAAKSAKAPNLKSGDRTFGAQRAPTNRRQCRRENT